MHLKGFRTVCARVVAIVAALATVMGSAVVLVVLTPAAAQAVVLTSTGVRCTIVGTAGRNVLNGTSRRDVICGRGGNDVINGRGGSDVIDGGSGNDSVTAGTGNDVVYGGSGRDTLDGGTGDDRLEGGTYGDTLRGGDGADTLRGATGNERILGGAGNDRLSGGDGVDVVAGEGGDDVVAGDLGDDELSGGAGGDLVDGGEGFNVCDAPGGVGDQQVRCVVDAEKPVVKEVTLSRTTVDVSAAEQIIEVEAHVTDDTGVKRVQIGWSASLVSGTVRDGIWATTIRVPRFVQPGPRDVDIFVGDRVGRDAYDTRHDAYTVTNTVYDKAMPVLQSLRLSATSVDVRTAAKSITATVRVTDDLAGPEDLYVCPAHAMGSGLPAFRQSGGCEVMTKVSGSAADSTWKGVLPIEKGAPSGTWNVQIWISDASGNGANDFWFGPEEFAALGSTNEPRYKAIPGGAGAFTVLGATPDTHAPVMTSLTLSPARVDSSSGAVQVTADIAGTDVEGITDAFLSVSGYAGYPNNPDWLDLVQVAWVQDFQRVSGTAQNGVWRATFTVPGGTPDGTYFIQASLQDPAHFESWVSRDSGWTTTGHLLDEISAPTHFVVANGGP